MVHNHLDHLLAHACATENISCETKIYTFLGAHLLILNLDHLLAKKKKSHLDHQPHIKQLKLRKKTTDGHDMKLRRTWHEKNYL